MRSLLSLGTQTKRIIFASSFLLLVFSGKEATAQMFSVQNAPSSSREEITYISIGIEPAALRFRGQATSTTQRFDFADGNIVRAQYDAENLVIRAGFGSNLGNQDAGYFSVGATLMPYFNLAGNNWFTLEAQAGFETDFTRIRPSGAVRELTWSTGSLGAGIRASLKPAQWISVSGGITRTVGFLTRDYGIEGGVTRSLNVPLTLHFRELFGANGVTLGMFIHRIDFDNDSNEYRYDWFGRQFFLGINF